MGFEIGRLVRLTLGYVGESESRMIQISMQDWLDRWPDAVIVVEAMRPDGYKYIPATEMENGMLTWQVNEGETAVEGKGFAQFMAKELNSGKTYKSRVVETITAASLEGFNDLVLEEKDPAKKWVDKVLEAAEETKTAAVISTEKSGIAEAAAQSAIEASKLVDVTVKQKDALEHAEGHLWRIVPDTDHEVTMYKVTDGVISATDSTVPGSDYMLCPRHLGFNFSGNDARCYLYFFDLVDGTFVPRWDILDVTTASTSMKNYVNPEVHILSRMLDIPEGVYMQIAIRAGSIDLYGWDGEAFGPALSADASIPAQDGNEYALLANGSSGLTIPGRAKIVCCKDGAIDAIHGYKDGVQTYIESESLRFWFPPEGYDFFRVRLYYGPEGNRTMMTVVGDASPWVSELDEATQDMPAARARKVLAACRKVCGIQWTAQAALAESNKYSWTYKEGVTYNGIPYSSQWFTTHFVGWHVSPHTFVNAAADPDSVFYKEVAEGWNDVTAPYYGLVCSSFATLVDGWPYPQTNAGFVYDPLISIAWSAMPPLGAVYSDLATHCVIPERIDRMGVVDAVSMYEAVRPVSGRTTRYSNIDKTADESKFNSAFDKLENYGFTARHMQATSMSDAPYADFDDVEILTASALPYHGDRCIHTSEDANVYINIKDSAATMLVLVYPDNAEQTIAINGAAQVDVKPYLTQDGIYFVYTDADSVQASFEYHAVTPVTYTIVDGAISFDRNDWWYAVCNLNGSAYFPDVEVCCVPVNAGGDYSAWCRDGHYMSKAHCVFYRGQYGAYVAQCVNG